MMPTATFRIFRGSGPDTAADGAFQDYQTEASEGMVVLDAVHQIQAESASDLAAASAVSPGRTAPSAPLVQLPTHASAYRPAGTPTLAAAQPSVEVVDAPPLQRGVAHWVVGVIAFVCLGLGFAAGLLVGGG